MSFDGFGENACATTCASQASRCWRIKGSSCRPRLNPIWPQEPRALKKGSVDDISVKPGTGNAGAGNIYCAYKPAFTSSKISM